MNINFLVEAGATLESSMSQEHKAIGNQKLCFHRDQSHTQSFELRQHSIILKRRGTFILRGMSILLELMK